MWTKLSSGFSHPCSRLWLTLPGSGSFNVYYTGVWTSPETWMTTGSLLRLFVTSSEDCGFQGLHCLAQRWSWVHTLLHYQADMWGQTTSHHRLCTQPHCLQGLSWTQTPEWCPEDPWLPSLCWISYFHSSFLLMPTAGMYIWINIGSTVS